MIKSFVLYGVSTLSLLTGSASLAGSCDTYSVAPGDTLRLISERYYGDREFSPIIYNANTDMVGEDPNTIEIGMQLEIPCRDGMRIPQATAFLAITPPEFDGDMPPRFMAKAGDTPFIGSDNSGVLPDILAAALRNGGFEGALEIARPENVSDVLQASVQPEALLAFPWIMPQCEDAASLSPQSAYICENYTFSDPLFEITLGIFTRADSPLVEASTPAAFAGKTICVPQFHTDDILRNSGILAANATAIFANNFQSCLAGLEESTFDAVVGDYQSFASYAPAQSGIIDISAFAQSSTLHAIAYSQNPAATEMLGIVNVGLKKILVSGEWFSLATQHLGQPSN